MRDKVVAIQRSLGLTDLQMAERLGLSRSAWNMVRRGQLPFSERMQMAAARAFPELVSDLVLSVSRSRDGEAA